MSPKDTSRATIRKARISTDVNVLRNSSQIASPSGVERGWLIWFRDLASSVSSTAEGDVAFGLYYSQ